MASAKSLYHLKKIASVTLVAKNAVKLQFNKWAFCHPVGMNNNNLYFFSNLDASKGRELV